MILFQFISLLFRKISEISGSDVVKKVHDLFPDSLEKTYMMQNVDTNNFNKFVVCPKCHTVFEHSDLLRASLSNCSFVCFPRHPHHQMRMKCGESLFKTVWTASGKQKFPPRKVFCYQSIIGFLRSLFKEPKLFHLMNKWKSRSIPPRIMSDVYDGAVWKSVVDVSGALTIALLLNVDWFQPYKHVAYSVGVIYITILNLPRQLRYRREHTLVVGIIPGLHKPKLHMSSYLEPLVDELLKLWRGIQIETCHGMQQVKAILICVACDIPAARKLGGFLGHASEKGCSRCLKSFPTEKFGEKKDYSGFDRSKWPQRSVEDHRKHGIAWKHACTLSKRKEIGTKFGVRYTELLRLPYFDTVRCFIVDPMHNVLLGTAKHLVTTWKVRGIISGEHFQSIQQTTDQFITPADIGRIPYKMQSQFSSFTADQWKNWTLIFSIVALRPVLPVEHYKCWCIFVDCCRLLCSRALSHDSVERLDQMLLGFCKHFERLYGKQACTPNLHLHGHLKECLMDFGPASSFWDFPFERLNGISGSVPTNHKDIETQLMRKFCCNQQILRSMENDDNEELITLLKQFLSSKGSLRYEELPKLPLASDISLSSFDLINQSCKLIPPVKEACLSADEHAIIDSLLKEIFGNAYKRTMLLCHWSSAAYISGDLYGSVHSIHSNSGMIYAKSREHRSFLPGISCKYLKINIILNFPNEGDQGRHIFLCGLNWLQEHPHKNWFHHPVEVWRKANLQNSILPSSFIPISSIACRCAHITNMVRFSRELEEIVTIVIPINTFQVFNGS